MKVQNKINILGTEYEILVQKANENPKLKDAYGLCEYYSKKIVLSEIEDNVNNFEKIEEFKKKVLRHEIIHAFFAESGLQGNCDYAECEELVDWIAIQIPKLAKIFEELDIL